MSGQTFTIIIDRNIGPKRHYGLVRYKRRTGTRNYRRPIKNGMTVYEAILKAEHENLPTEFPTFTEEEAK